ncbi:MAG TPA: barstar family protein [Pyrinomonadaceae bacterium]|nr:barstar family protein [Pyrinomonadaceae bacterium]
MATARLNTESIFDWQSFHKMCREAFGFPDFYGMNMNAWIDCLTFLNEGDGMSRFHLAEGEMLHIEVSNTKSFNSRLPEIFDALVECSSFVNQRYIEDGKSPMLSLIFL